MLVESVGGVFNPFISSAMAVLERVKGDFILLQVVLVVMPCFLFLASY